ncbi:MAG TPA: VWA domain-containing protein, partial [Acidobacteriota bacterium]|nr:VWA domain-containing protein [Acidobacteriota bacterium]
DFAVSDNGTPVVLTEFERHALGAPGAKDGAAEPPEAVSEPGKPAPPVSRPAGLKYFLFFDFAFNNVRGVLKARNAALHFLDTVVSPGDEVAVLTYSAVAGLAFHEYLTADHAKVRKVIEEIGHSDIAGRATEIEDQYWRLMQDSPGSGAGAAMGLNFRAEAELNRQESKSMAQKYMAKMTALARALRLVEGQKHFILFSTGIPNSLIYGYTPGNVGFRSDTSTASGDHVLRRQNEAMYREFSAAGCSFYAFDTRESAIEASLFAYDEQTFATGSRSMSAMGDATNVFKDNKATGLNSLKRLTDITGGRYYANIALYDKNLDQVRAATGSYYVLGYSINERWDGLFHDVKVEVKRKGCEVRTQAGYFNPKPFGEYSDLEKRIHLFDLAINERAFSRMPVDIPMAALASSAEGLSRLGVLARIPGEVTAKFDGRRIEFVALFFDEKGDIREIVRQEADPASFRGRDMAFAAGSSLNPGDYSCRLVVRDMDTGLSAVASARGTVGKPQTTGLHLGTPLLLEARTGCAFLSASAWKGKEPFPWDAIYPYDSALYAPVFGALPAAASGVRAVVPCSASGGAAADLSLRAALVDAVSGAQALLAASVSGRVQKGPREILTIDLPTAGIPAGTYYLHFYAEERSTGSLGHTVTTLVIPPR